MGIEEVEFEEEDFTLEENLEIFLPSVANELFIGFDDFGSY